MENDAREVKRDISDRCVLVGIETRDNDAEEVESGLRELEGLIKTAGGECVARLTQKRESIDARTVIGSGKVAELAYLCACNEVTLVVFDTELSPSQIRNVEDILGDGVRVIDRSMLILDIFALHAVTGEGKLQVELAQLKYTAPRLQGRGAELSRLGGGIGTRGPGESKLETDRRYMRRRIMALEEQIEKMEKNRRTMRAARDKSSICEVAIVGYTNAGKSTLLNYLTNAGILAEDKLFATLDPTTRKFELPCGETILLTDTVGFIRKLPHHLIMAFRSTLEEACHADVILILTDISDPEFREKLEVTEKLLAELGAAGKPTLYVFNKCDRGMAELGRIGDEAAENQAFISASTGQGIDIMVKKLERIVTDGKHIEEYLIPNSDAGALNTLYKLASVESVEYGADGITVTALVDKKVSGMMRKYSTAPSFDGDDGEEDI